MPKLIIVRGLPGSGKSTYAKKLVYDHVEADQYFTAPSGGYIFDPTKLKDAHKWCQEQVEECLERAFYSPFPVVVANTFTQKWELAHYLDLAKKYCYDVEIHKCVGNFQNVHGVPPDAIWRMQARWEDIPSEIIVSVTCDQNISATL